MAAVEAPGGDGEVERIQRDRRDLDRAFGFALELHRLGWLPQLDDLRRAHGPHLTAVRTSCRGFADVSGTSG